MPKTDNTSKNHYVPQFYLKSFMDANNKIWQGTILNGKIEPKKIENVCYKYNLYTIADKFTVGDIDRISKTWFRDLVIPEDFKYTLVAYLNGDLASVFWQQVPYKTDSEIKNIFNSELNEVLNFNSCKMQENLFTYIYESKYLQSTLSKIIERKDISFLKQGNSNDIQLYSWLNITCFIDEEMMKKMTTIINNDKLINSIKQECKLPRKHLQNDFYNLLLYMVNQFFRTEKLSKIARENFEKSNLGLKSFGLEQNPQKIYFLFLHIVPINLLNNCLNLNYKLILIENQSNIEFITSDNPCINLYATLTERRILEDNELELYLPLSPQIALLFSNRECYRVLSKPKLVLNNDSQVIPFNGAVKKSASKFIYANNSQLLNEILKSSVIFSAS